MHTNNYYYCSILCYIYSRYVTKMVAINVQFMHNLQFSVLCVLLTIVSAAMYYIIINLNKMTSASTRLEPNVPA